MSALVPVTVATKSGPVDVVGEPTSNPHFAITPALCWDGDTVRLAASTVLTHIPTGKTVIGASWGVDYRDVVPILEKITPDWSTAPDLTTEQANEFRKALFDLW